MAYTVTPLIGIDINTPTAPVAASYASYATNFGPEGAVINASDGRRYVLAQASTAIPVGTTTCAISYTAPVTITAISQSGNVATVTAAGHGLLAGFVVTISGAVPAGYNGTYTVASVPSTSTFMLNLPVSGLASATNVGAYTLATAQATVAATGGSLVYAVSLPPATGGGAANGQAAAQYDFVWIGAGQSFS